MSLFKGGANFNTNSGWICWFGAALNGRDSKVTRLHVERGNHRLFQMGRLGKKCCFSAWKMRMFRGVCSCQRICSQGFPQVLSYTFKSWKWWKLERYGHLAYRCGVMMDDNNLKPNSNIMFVSFGMMWSQPELSISIFLFVLNVSCYILL